MQKSIDERLDELLVAHLDGELDERSQAELDSRLERDAAARDRLAALSESTALVRAAFDEDLREEVPERLIAAARGETLSPASSRPAATVVPFPARAKTLVQQRRWWVSMAAAASLFGVFVGTGVGYYGLSKPAAPPAVERPAPQPSASLSSWLDNVAGYHKMFIAGIAGERSFADFPSNGESGEIIKTIAERLPQQGNLRVPNLKPWGLQFQGARLLVVEGRPATQFLYTTDNPAIGPLTVVVASSKRQDMAPSFDQRQDLNVLYWRSRGRAYAIVGQANVGYLWNLHNDIAWQLDAI